MAGTMGRLSIGVTGLQTSQYAINTTSHNLTNTQTEGYTRQQVMLTDRTYKKIYGDSIYANMSGLGVVTSEVQQVRDNFVDDAYRTENGRMDYYKAQYESVTEVENFFGELEGEDFNTNMNDLWKALQELQKEPSSIVTRSSFIATAQSFMDRVQEIRDSIIEYQRNMNAEINDKVDRINEIAKEIEEINKNILNSEASKIENANDYRDARNLLVDELSGIVKTETVANSDGTIEVYIEGKCLVTKGKTYDLSTVKVCDYEKYQTDFGFTSDSMDFVMPVWADDQDALFNINQIPATETNSDIGSLKGLLMSRGYFVSDYTDVPVQPDKPLAENFSSDADYQTAMADYRTELTQYNTELDYYNKFVEPYMATGITAQFDVLINAMVTGINDIICPNTEIELNDGTFITVLDEENAPMGVGNGNEIQGTELFVRNGTPRYTEQTVTLADGTTKTVQVYNAEDKNNYYSLYTSGNIQVNSALLTNPSLLPLTSTAGEEAQGVIDNMLNLWNETFSTVSPNTLVECNFVDYYAGMTEQLADRGYTYNALAKTQESTVNSLSNQRQQVMGVSSDEELSNLIKFQHAYNAASRYITTVSEMIEHLITQLGM